MIITPGTSKMQVGHIILQLYTLKPTNHLDIHVYIPQVTWPGKDFSIVDKREQNIKHAQWHMQDDEMYTHRIFVYTIYIVCEMCPICTTRADLNCSLMDHILKIVCTYSLDMLNMLCGMLSSTGSHFSIGSLGYKETESVGRRVASTRWLRISAHLCCLVGECREPSNLDTHTSI